LGPVSFGEQSNYEGISAGSFVLQVQTDSGSFSFPLSIGEGEEMSVLLSGSVRRGDLRVNVLQDPVVSPESETGSVRLVNGSSGISSVSLDIGGMRLSGVGLRDGSEAAELPPGNYPFTLSSSDGNQQSGQVSVQAGNDVTILASGSSSDGVLTASSIIDRD